MIDLLLFLYFLQNKNKYLEKNQPSLSDNQLLGVWDKQPNELYAIGDMHGDFYAMKQALESTGCVIFEKSILEEILVNGVLIDGCDYYTNDKIKWNPEKNDCMIVFAGDIIDRCRNIHNDKCNYTVNDENCDYKMLKLLFYLDDLAKKYNSRVIVILGNHEIMNLSNDLRYVSGKGLYKERVKQLKKLLKENIERIYGLVRINKYVIAHGGINSKFFKRYFIFKESDEESILVFNKILRDFIYNNENENIIKNLHNPLWDRSNGIENYVEKKIYDDIFINNILKIKNHNELKIIVAHCPQFNLDEKKGINQVDRIWRIDAGMSRAWLEYKSKEKVKEALGNINFKITDVFIESKLSDFNRVQVLQITNDEEKVITGILSLDYFYNDVFYNNKEEEIKYFLNQINLFFKK